MNWIVVGEDKERITLVSKNPSENENGGLLPKGSYLTIEEGKTKFILRVDNSIQLTPYSPSPMIVDMDLSPLQQDQKCQNLVVAYRIKNISDRKDGLIDYIRPQLIARRSNQEEIDLAMGADKKGPRVFVATIHSCENQLLIDDDGKYITTKLPIDMFYHQMLICGATGSGKTVTTKYLAQYFVEELEGAVLAINVKDVDFLKMDIASKTKNHRTLKEWEILSQTPHGIQNFMVYYPANTTISPTKGVSPEVCQRITLDVKNIEPESLTGLIQGLTDTGTRHLPNIFRYWQENARNKDERDFTFSNFAQYFSRGIDDKCRFRTLNSRGEESEVPLARGTFDNIQRSLEVAIEFFDNKDAMSLEETDILVPGKMSVIDVAGQNGIQFGSILLRHLLHNIVNAKTEQRSTVPILIIIDEVHRFYNTETLGDLDTICRTGRSQEIGVIFSSQNSNDIPTGLSSVINTKIIFKSDTKTARMHGIHVSSEEMESLNQGYGVGSIFNLPQLKIFKFPMALGGVFPKEKS